MKIQKYIYLFALAALMALAGCSADDTPADDHGQQPAADGKAKVHIRVSAADASGAPSMATRGSYSDGNADDAEMMNTWTVVAVYASGTNKNKVAFIHAAKPATADREIDDLVELDEGTYDFYSFANIPPSVVCQLMGIEGLTLGSEVTRGGSNDASGSNTGSPITTYTATSDPLNDNSVSGDGVYSFTFTETTIDADAMTAKDVGIDGNGFDISATNVFGGTGIPMSNKQTIEITGDTNVDLIVVRMIAKIELRLYNATGSPIKVKSAKLSDVNQNYDNNIKLLPLLTRHDDMAAKHGDIQPNLGATTYWADYTYTPATAVSVPANTPYGGASYETLTFYVNESQTPQNAYGHFYLTLEIDRGSSPSEFRYALIDDTASDDTTDDWSHLSRNDYRIIPIVLDDYVLDVIPYDFPPIGVLPASVKEEDGLYTINFHDYGHFHLVPVVKQYSTGAVLPYGSGANYWTLDGTFANAWTSWTDHTKAKAYDNEDADFANTYSGIYTQPFYETGSTATTDADDNGGAPAWDATQHFIFGKIADPGSAPAKDVKVYHELTVKLYTGGTFHRDITARIYMILDTEQMMYVAPWLKTAPRRPHKH